MGTDLPRRLIPSSARRRSRATTRFCCDATKPNWRGEWARSSSMGSLVGQIEQSGAATWIRESGVLYGYPLILFLHTLGLSTLVGLNSAINLRLLGFASAIPLASLERLFSLMWAGFG